MIKIYAYAGCDSCRNALKFLNQREVPHEVLPIRERPPTKAELKRMLAAYGGEMRKLFNTSGQDYKALGLAATLTAMSTAAALELLATNGNLVKRPFVVTADGGMVGFKREEWEARFGRND